MCGFLQLPVWDGDRKAGFRLHDLESGQERTLARRAPDDRGQLGTPFIFEPEGFELARRATRSLPRGTVVVVDGMLKERDAAQPKAANS